MEESISLEETNKIRISLGLKPLTDDKAPTLDSEKVAENNYATLREKEAKDREAKYVTLTRPLDFSNVCNSPLYIGRYRIKSRSKLLNIILYFYVS